MTQTDRNLNDPSAQPTNGILPFDPFRSLNVHFGMLLGESDFKTLGAYQRGKAWLHHAWGHGGGVVWGYGVGFDDGGELRVGRGLALDHAGRELHLDRDACVDLGIWFAKHREDPGFELETLPDGSVRFDAHVVVRFSGCLTRSVPALLESCEGAGSTTAYSRVFESVCLELEPGPFAPARPALHERYLRVRLFYGLRAPRRDSSDVVLPVDRAVLDALAEARAHAPEERSAFIRATLHRLLVEDALDLLPAFGEAGGTATPSSGQLPAIDEDGSAALVLGALTGIELEPVAASGAPAWTYRAGSAEVSTTLREQLAPSALLQQLLFAQASPRPAGGSGGARFDPARVTVSGTRVVLVASAPLLEASVTPSAFVLSQFDETSGWSALPLDSATLRDGHEVQLELRQAPTGRLRLIAQGTGSTPILGADGGPIAGSSRGELTLPGAGADFVWMEGQ